MVRYATQGDLEENLTKRLLADSDIGRRCPNLKVDGMGPYCGRGLEKKREISEQRREICDNSSLQLWCLDGKRYSKCIWYNGEPLE